MKNTSLKQDRKFFNLLKLLRVEVRRKLGIGAASNQMVLLALENQGFPRAGSETRESVYARYLGCFEHYEEMRREAQKRVTEIALARKAKADAGLLSIPKFRKLKPLPKLQRSPDYKCDPDFYSTPEWRQVRYLALRNNGAKCQCCGATAADGLKLHVDHIQPRYHRPDLSLDLNNLQVLCEDCNLGKGAWDATDWRGVK